MFRGPLCLIATAAALTACTPFEPGDPRVGSYWGSFKQDDFTAPVYVEVVVRSDGLTHFWTGVESGPEVGSEPEQLGGGSRDLRFSTKRNGQDYDVYYDVDAVLKPGDQVIEGTLSYWTQNHGVDRVPGLMRQPFRVHRKPNGPGYVQTVPGDFSCTSGDVAFLGGFGFLQPDASVEALIPKPSCFSGPLLAIELWPGATTDYSVQVRGSVGTSLNKSARSMAVFSSCDGQELACDYIPPWDGGVIPDSKGVRIPLRQFESVLLVSTGDDARSSFWWLP